MTREQLEHVLRAASQVADDPRVLVIGSQSILGAIPEERLPLAATAAGREKGHVFPAALIRSQLIDPAVIAERIESVDVSPALRQRLRNWIATHSGSSRAD